jgi:hypothetical protein
MLQGAMAVWFALTAGSLAFVVWDSAVNGVTSWVQRVAWILVTVYGGPVAAGDIFPVRPPWPPQPWWRPPCRGPAPSWPAPS